MLSVIEKSLNELLGFNNRNFNSKQRLEYFVSINKSHFSRKDYMDKFKDISSSTASRDLKNGIELNIFTKIGEMNKTKYKIIVPNNMYKT